MKFNKIFDMYDSDSIIQLLLQNSPVISREKERLEAFWDEALQSLNVKDKEEYKKKLKKYKPNSIKDLILYFYFLYSGCFYLLIQYQNRNYFEMGKKIKIMQNPLLKQNKFQWNQIEVYSIYPYKSEMLISKIFTREFFPMIRKMILNDSVFLVKNSYDYIENTINYIERKSKPYLENNIPVTLTHFKFENLEKYINELGNLGIYNFILEIDAFIKSYLKKRDVSIILSYNSFLVLSIGATKEIIYERFKNIYIEIKSIVLDYHFYIETLYHPMDSIKEIFYKLKI